MVALIALLTADLTVMSTDAVQVCAACVTVQLYVVFAVGVTVMEGVVASVDQAKDCAV